MRVSSIFVASIAIALFVCANSASTILAGGARHFKDSGQEAFRVSLYVSPSRVLSGRFIVYDKTSLHCDHGEGALVGAWAIRNVKIKNGRFQAVEIIDGYGHVTSFRLVFRGVLKGDTIRGAVSLRFSYRDGKDVNQCWSGKSKGNPAVPYVARVVP
jgi:hypothetical protein